MLSGIEIFNFFVSDHLIRFNLALTVLYESPGGGGGICTGVCGHRIGKLTHPQTKAGPKTDPFSDYLQ